VALLWRATIPDVTDKGLLPPGIHVATLDEVAAAFCSIGNQSHRQLLWNSFLAYLEEVKSKGIVLSYYLDGSFATSRPKPRDIDIVLELPAPNPYIMPILTLPLFNRAQVKAERCIDVLRWHPEVTGYASGRETLLAFCKS
jgi:Family of unknown function (DUF6932)